MQSSRQQNAWLQSNFYRDQFRKILRWLIMCIFIIFILISAIIYLVLTEAPQNYYANTTEGKILTMPPPRIGA